MTKWLPLSLSSGPKIGHQVQSVIELYETLCHELNSDRSAHNSSQIYSTCLQSKERAIVVLTKSIKKRMLELEEFYLCNDLDPKAAFFETQRLKLKRSLADMEPLLTDDLKVRIQAKRSATPTRRLVGTKALPSQGSMYPAQSQNAALDGTFLNQNFSCSGTFLNSPEDGFEVASHFFDQPSVDPATSIPSRSEPTYTKDGILPPAKLVERMSKGRPNSAAASASGDDGTKLKPAANPARKYSFGSTRPTSAADCSAQSRRSTAYSRPSTAMSMASAMPTAAEVEEEMKQLDALVEDNLWGTFLMPDVSTRKERLKPRTKNSQNRAANQPFRIQLTPEEAQELALRRQQMQSMKETFLKRGGGMLASNAEKKTETPDTGFMARESPYVDAWELVSQYRTEDPSKWVTPNDFLLHWEKPRKEVPLGSSIMTSSPVKQLPLKEVNERPRFQASFKRTNASNVISKRVPM